MEKWIKKKTEKLKEEIEEDFGFLKGRILGIVLFGSQLTEHAHKKSDIDVCVVVGETEDKKCLRQGFRVQSDGKVRCQVL